MLNIKDFLNIKSHTLTTKEEVERVQKELTAGDKKPSAIEIGQLRRKFFTREYPTVKGCGHSFTPGNAPRTHCEPCWFAYFLDNQGLMKQTLEIIKEIGEAPALKALTNLHGNQWVKYFKWFLGQIVAMQTAEREANVARQIAEREANASITGKPEAA